MPNVIYCFDRDYIMRKCRYLKLKAKAVNSMINLGRTDVDFNKKMTALLTEGDKLFGCN